VSQRLRRRLYLQAPQALPNSCPNRGMGPSGGPYAAPLPRTFNVGDLANAAQAVLCRSV